MIENHLIKTKLLIKTMPVIAGKTVRMVMTTLTVALATLGMTVTAAHAPLIERDLGILGDELITLDTILGLEWLDITTTFSLSFGSAESTLSVIDQGFRRTFSSALSANTTIAHGSDPFDNRSISSFSNAHFENFLVRESTSPFGGIAAVAEPPIWALLLGGFFLILAGFQIRHRSRSERVTGTP